MEVELYCPECGEHILEMKAVRVPDPNWKYAPGNEFDVDGTTAYECSRGSSQMFGNDLFVPVVRFSHVF